MKPNYKDGSIVNLMSSIGESFGAKSEYAPLKILNPAELKNSKNTVLIIFDGLGYNFIRKNGRGTVFEKYMKGKMTSVFPPTTASAITSFLTGTAPQQHAYTGWFMHLKEIGCVATILPFTPRFLNASITDAGIKKQDILKEKAFTEKINAKSYIITNEKSARSVYTKELSKKAKIIPYKSLDDFFIKMGRTIKSKNENKFIYAYWPNFDSLSHDFGIGSKKTKNHFFELNKQLEKFVKNINGTNTTLIITADHGLVDTTKKRTIWLEDHPKLREYLTLPLCGDARAIYCYVHPSKAKQFEKYVRTKLKKECYLYKSEELIKKDYFGLFKENSTLFDRVGDYTLIMKENYCFRDNLFHQKKKFMVGVHGGISEDEMLVPLVLIKC